MKKEARKDDEIRAYYDFSGGCAANMRQVCGGYDVPRSYLQPSLLHSSCTLRFSSFFAAI